LGQRQTDTADHTQTAMQLSVIYIENYGVQFPI